MHRTEITPSLTYVYDNVTNTSWFEQVLVDPDSPKRFRIRENVGYINLMAEAITKLRSAKANDAKANDEIVSDSDVSRD